MASENIFAQYPPFPEDAPIADVPSISLGKLVSGDATHSRELFEICRTVGFFLLDLTDDASGQAVLQSINEVFGIAKDVFDLDEEEKYEFRQDASKGNFVGWKQVGIMKTDGGAPDRCEFYSLLQDDVLENIPAKQHAPPLQRRKDAVATFLREATRILQHILGVLDAHLGLPIGTFAERMSPERTSGTLLRLIRYAPQPHGDRRTALLSHTDMGCITFLCSVLGGLQILQPGGDPAHESDWRYIRPRPGCAIINIGDALVEWSGGILRSNMHRVTYAPGAQAECTRYSMAYLVRANKEVSMKRLVSERIPTAEADQEEDLDISCEQWELEKSKALTAGADNARSRGGRELQFPLTSPTPVRA